MTKHSPADSALGPLEDYATCFDYLFASLAQRQAFRRYLEGLLLPADFLSFCSKNDRFRNNKLTWVICLINPKCEFIE